MKREVLLALDLGTTGVRALVVTSRGEVSARAYRSLSASFPQPGRVEQDAAEMWDRSVEVMRQALDLAKVDAASIAGIGVVSQRATTIAWDSRTLEPLTAVIGWQDQRTYERVAGFRAAGIPINTGASATKFEWWLQNDAAVKQAASKRTLCLGTPDSWLTAKLTAGKAHVTDPGNASCTALFYPNEGTWAESLTDLFGVPLEALPVVVPTSSVVGATPSRLLGAAVPVAARAGDQMAAAFAQGIYERGQAKLTLGTSGMLDLNTGDEPSELRAGSYPLVLWKLEDGSQAFCLEGVVRTAGAAVDWCVDLGLAPEAAAVDSLAREISSTDGVMFVPALQGLGTPHFDEAARGLLIGLTRGTGPAQIARAVLEGVAHRCIDVCEELSLDEQPLRVDGGLAQSDFLVQELADLGEREVHRAAETETTALGAAYLAGLATGVFSSPEVCLSVMPVPKHFIPGRDSRARGEARERWAQALERAAGDR